ncbi:hypothetical protein [Natrinema amylolyticum]|uniref:hypothetical protein n=1 Tax=Natrinema amylolyticum TaxID=2878679 RepID=UPI001CFB949E|nr:hypothetical protein [Natrinema amylolyticum]
MTSRIGIAMVVVAIVSLVVSSGGVSSVAMDRSIEVAVTDDESEQLVAFDARESGENETTIDVTNRADSELTIAIVDESQGDDLGSNVSVDSTTESVEPGSNASIEVSDVSCENGGPSERLPIEIRATTGSTTIETTVDAAVTCNR